MMNTGRRTGSGRPGRALWLCLVLPGGLVGCGGENLAPVSGKATCKGEPAKGGTLIFSPLPSSEGDVTQGRSASAVIEADGTYVLSTNQPKDGAKIGRHSVRFMVPQPELTEEQRTNPKYFAPPPLYQGMVVKPNEVEVKSGKNTIDFELVYPAK